tara:strand:+ start:74120 stop:75517 length:1398 start_codon:yes stop_codon:yes gene_type:complete
MSKILKGEEAKQALLEGTSTIGDAVLSTFGPNGHNVIVSNPEGRFITKDGVSVAKEVNAYGEPQNEAIQMLKEACLLTNSQAGDGTTTSMLFAKTIIEEGMKLDTNGIIIKREMEACLPKIIKRIDTYKRACTIDDIYNIALVSTNNDKFISDIILKVFFNNLKADILFDISSTKETTTEFIEGYSIDGSAYDDQYDYLSNTLTDAYVYVVDGKVNSLRDMRGVLENMKNDNQYVIIAEEFSKDLQKVIYNNRSFFNIKLIKSPGYSQGRKMILENIAAYVGVNVITPKQFYKASLTKTITTFSNKNGRLIFHNIESNPNLKSRIEFLNSKMTNTTDSFEREQLSNLLSKFNSGISIVNIGAKSEIEYRELHDKLEDAVNACKSALKDGIVLGGGITALEVSEDIDNEILKIALQAPHKLLNKPSKESIIENNIYDPALVLKCAIINAIAVAGTILTTNVIVINE